MAKPPFFCSRRPAGDAKCERAFVPRTRQRGRRLPRSFRTTKRLQKTALSRSSLSLRADGQTALFCSRRPVGDEEVAAQRRLPLSPPTFASRTEAATEEKQSPSCGINRRSLFSAFCNPSRHLAGARFLPKN